MTATTSPDRLAHTTSPVLDVLAARWSPRAFEPDAPIDEVALRSALEAARWAPSASNTQPWRFIVGRRGTPEHRAIVDTLMGFNQVWAPQAAVLVVAVAETAAADGTPRRWAVYDLGQAVAHLSVQAHHDGLHVHQMGGFHPEQVRSAFGLDDRFEPVTVIALGTLGDPADLVGQAPRAGGGTPRAQAAGGHPDLGLRSLSARRARRRSRPTRGARG